MSELNYERDPAKIYRQSFSIIRNEVDLSRFDPDMAQLVIRLVHACGLVSVADNIEFSKGAFEAGRIALEQGAPILCDVEMVRYGIINRLLPTDNKTLCLLNESAVIPLAARLKTTRSAAQIKLWKPYLKGSIIAIGNAPTALFRLLELLAEGADKPALILGLPVGFVGAEESKAELIANSQDVPFITVKGRMGGSAMASAAVNALAGRLENYG